MSQTIAAATPAAELADGVIVERIRGGDIGLYEILVRRHNQRLYRTIRAILRDDRDVEDVMQQAYVDAYTHLDQFRGTAKFATWLTRIAVNRASGAAWVSAGNSPSCRATPTPLSPSNTRPRQAWIRSTPCTGTS